MVYLIAFIMVYFLQLLLKLNEAMTLVLGIFVLLVIPLHRRWYRRMKENQTRFYEVSLYLDTLLYAFVKDGKVDSAVRNAWQTLPAGHMKDVVKKALDYMTVTFDEAEVLEEALAMIAKEFPCKRIRDVHKFMTHVEYYGGEIERPVALLLTDKGRWEKRIQSAILQRRKQFTDVVLSVIASLIICGAILYLPIGEVDMSQMWLIQIVTMVVLVLDDFVIQRGQKFLAVDWIGMHLTEDEEYYVRKMEQYQTYDMKKEQKLSVLLGGLGCVATGYFFLQGQEWMVLLLLLVTLFGFNQHKIGRQLMRKTLTKELKYAFPNWLLDLVLLLQTENVQVALQKSREYVPGVLQKELQLLTERLELQPEASEPYHMFLQSFSIPEVHSAMGILYSISIGNSGHADKQIGELVEKNQELLDETERKLLLDSGSGMYILFMLPVLTATFKLLVDMVVLMLCFLQTPMI